MVYGTPLNSLGRWSNESIFLAVCTTFQSYLSHLDVVYFAVEVLIYGFDLGDKCTTYFEVWWWSRGVFVSLTHHLLERPLLAHMWRLFDIDWWLSLGFLLLTWHLVDTWHGCIGHVEERMDALLGLWHIMTLLCSLHTTSLSSLLMSHLSTSGSHCELFGC